MRREKKKETHSAKASSCDLIIQFNTHQLKALREATRLCQILLRQSHKKTLFMDTRDINCSSNLHS